MRLYNKGGLIASWLVIDFVTARSANGEVRKFLQDNKTGLPYYNNENSVINLEKVFFYLDEDRNYQPSLFYPGKRFDFKPDGLL